MKIDPTEQVSAVYPPLSCNSQHVCGLGIIIGDGCHCLCRDSETRLFALPTAVVRSVPIHTPSAHTRMHASLACCHGMAPWGSPWAGPPSVFLFSGCTFGSVFVACLLCLCRLFDTIFAPSLCLLVGWSKSVVSLSSQPAMVDCLSHRALSGAPTWLWSCIATSRLASRSVASSGNI